LQNEPGRPKSVVQALADGSRQGFQSHGGGFDSRQARHYFTEDDHDLNALGRRLPRFVWFPIQPTERAMKVYLKIKIMSLAAEARIIRNEECKWPGPSDARQGLHRHRMIDVRRESRIANLAYGFLRGRSYRALEAKCYEEPNWQRVAELVRKYGQPGLPVDAIRKALKDWIALDAKMEQGALTAASFDSEAEA